MILSRIKSSRSSGSPIFNTALGRILMALNLLIIRVKSLQPTSNIFFDDLWGLKSLIEIFKAYIMIVLKAISILEVIWLC